MNLQDFQKYKDYYKTIGSIACPYLKGDINFNSKGWGHLIRKGKTFRPAKDIQRRVLQLENAIEVLKLSGTIQEKEIIIQTEYSISFLGFIAIINDSKIKVIIRKDNDGQYYFYSVMTDYITSVKRDIRKIPR